MDNDKTYEVATEISKQQTKLDNSIVAQAYGNMIKTYKDAIMYLESQLIVPNG